MQAAPGVQARYTRTAQNEIHRQFHRLPNPDLVMYVFPHLAGTDPVPVPGYSTVFPLYQRVQYAMPGRAWRTTDGLVAAVVTQARRSAPADAMDAADDAWAARNGAGGTGCRRAGQRVRPSGDRGATQADRDALYGVAPSFADLLPWVE